MYFNYKIAFRKFVGDVLKMMWWCCGEIVKKYLNFRGE